MNLQELGGLVRKRREALGLSQQRLAQLAGLSRTTINLLEMGRLTDLGIAKVSDLMDLVGLTLHAGFDERSQPNALLMASRSASVSYKEILTPEELLAALSTGKIPSGRNAHVASWLDEAPLKVVVSSVELASKKTAVPPKQVWKHVSAWAREFNSPRHAWV